MNNSTAVIYHYFEKDLTYKNNLVYFLSVGILDKIDYYILISGKCTIDLPDWPNVTYIKIDNWNNDFGGYIKFFQMGGVERYDEFVFVNSSVRGPYLPGYAHNRWVDAFLDRLCGDVHLVGASINILPADSPHSERFSAIFKYAPPFVHVQTTAYALSAAGVSYLKSIGFYDVDKTLSKKEVISYYELRMSQEIINYGWNINCFIPVYDGLDYRKSSFPFPNFSSRNGDVLLKNGYYGRTLSPAEAMFVKVNRDMISEEDLASYTFTALVCQSKKIQDFADGMALLASSYDLIRQKRSGFRWLKRMLKK
jgi:hypothetical protein